MPNSSYSKVTQVLAHAPLPEIIGRLGLSIAQAQAALDENAVKQAAQMNKVKVQIGDEKRSLLALGFTPSFYAFTEATIEARLDFHMAETSTLSVGAEVGYEGSVFAASVNASYSRRFSFEASGSSSVTARLAAVPAPPALVELLQSQTDSNS